MGTDVYWGDLVDETSCRNLGSKEDKDVEEQLV